MWIVCVFIQFLLSFSDMIEPIPTVPIGRGDFGNSTDGARRDYRHSLRSLLDLSDEWTAITQVMGLGERKGGRRSIRGYSVS